MRVVLAILALLLALFALVQYDDPDGIAWGLAYAVPAALAGFAAARPRLVGRPAFRAVALAALALAVVGMIVFWPEAEGWWRRDVWWEDEPAREGMGLMIVAFATLIVALVALRAPRASR